MIKTIEISRLFPSPFQPRKEYSRKALQAMAQTIDLHGVLQPIKVRPISKVGREVYEIVYGHLRCEAAKIAGQKEITVLVEELSDDEARQQALIENLHRKDLTDFELADGVTALVNLTAPREKKKRRGHRINKSGRIQTGRQSAVAQQLGLSFQYISTLLDIARMHPEARALLLETRKQEGWRVISARSAREAEKLGGLEGVRLAISKRWSWTYAQRMREQLQQAAKKAPDRHSAIREKVLAGELRTPEAIRQAMDAPRGTRPSLEARLWTITDNLITQAAMASQLLEMQDQIADEAWLEATEKIDTQVLPVLHRLIQRKEELHEKYKKSPLSEG